MPFNNTRQNRTFLAINFDGTDDSGSTSSENRSGNHDATFELWFKPMAFPTAAPRTIFEHGNTLRGISFGLRDQSFLAESITNMDLGQLDAFLAKRRFARHKC